MSRVSREGMSLLELIVGMAITGIVLAGGFTAFGSVLQHRERAAESMHRVSHDAAVRQTLIAWLSGARVTAEESGPGFFGIDGMHGSLADAELRFLTRATIAGGSGSALVRLFIDRDEETPERGLVAEVSAWPTGARERIELEGRAEALEIRYLSSAGGPRQWLPSWISNSVMPAGLELRILAPGTDALPPLLALPILVAFDGVR